MSGVLLLILVLIAAGFLLALFYKRPSRYIANLKKHADSTRRIIWCLVLLSAGTVAVCTDFLDISSILLGDQEQLRQQESMMLSDLEGIYGLHGKPLESARARIEGLVAISQPTHNKGLITTCALFLGVAAALYIVLSVYDTASEGNLAADLRDSDRLKEAALKEAGYQKKLYENTCEVLKHVDTVVSAKHLRLQRVLRDHGADAHPSKAVRACRLALSPDEQFQCLAACAHKFFFRPEPNVTVRVALFLPEANEARLYVKASTDGMMPSVIDSPNGKHRDMFRTDVQIPRSVAVTSFQTGRKQIIRDCSADPRFRYFSEGQKNQILSMVACPLACGNIDVRGVLTADANRVGYFEESPAFNSMIDMISGEIALRLAFEQSMDELLSKFAGAAPNAEVGHG